MSREILFRGKRVDNNQWTEGFLSFIYTDGRNSNGFIYTDKAQIYSPVEVRLHDVYTATVGQFTGLCDKNGVKIFEGDIVDIWSAGQHCHGLVKWGQGSVSFFVEVPCTPHIWHLSGGGKNYDEETCEVIGNIHANLELLKEEAE